MDDLILDGLAEQRMVPIDSVIMYEANIKQHPEAQVRRIMYSIANYGWDQPIVVDEELVIIKGHGRLLAARELELEEVPIVQVTHLNEAQKIAARISDNKVSESEYDSDVLWGELKEATEAGFKLNELGFSMNAVKGMFKESFDLKELGIDPKTQVELDKEQVSQDGFDEDQDATAPVVESFMIPFKGDEAWMRRIPMVDFLNMHDQIQVGLSGGKDSTTALLWCLDNCDPDKVFPYFSNLGWGVDWPHQIVTIKMIEKKYGKKIVVAGPSDPKLPGRFEDYLLQFGMMSHLSCWIRNLIKIPGINGMARYMEEQSPGASVVQIVAVRWAESDNRRRTYGDRGYIADSKGRHFASPILLWEDRDCVQYLKEKGMHLAPMYLTDNRSGCLICPHSRRKHGITVRKYFPKLWRQWLEWHAFGARRSNGELHMDQVKHVLASISDLSEHELKDFSSSLSPMALNSVDWEKWIEEQYGDKLSQKQYCHVPYDPQVHDFPSDVPDSYISRKFGPDIESKESAMCSLSG